MKPESNEWRLSPGVPPWIWYWIIVTFIFFVPTFLEEMYVLINQPFDIGAITLAPYDFVVTNSLLFIPQIAMPIFVYLPHFFLVSGLLTVLIPQLRSRYIERKINLVPPSSSMPSAEQLIEIEDFIKSNAPGLKVKVNLKRPGRLWMYPNGYRTATLAIFYGFVILWKTDREAAEAVLLHEIAHYRRGDALFVGPSSFLEIALKLALVCCVVFVALPLLAVSITIPVEIFIEGLNNTNVTPIPKWQILVLFFASLVAILVVVSVITLLFPIVLLIQWMTLLSCIWLIELSADHFVANSRKHKHALLRELSKKTGKIVWWRWILFRLSHPPERLRRFFLRHSSSYGFSLLLLIYPLSVLLLYALVYPSYIVLEIAKFALSYIVDFFGNKSYSITQSETTQYVTDILWPWTINYMQNIVVREFINFLLVTAILLMWPFVVRSWEQFFTRAQAPFALNVANDVDSSETALLDTTTQESSHSKYYVLAATFTGSILFVRLLIWLN